MNSTAEAEIKRLLELAERAAASGRIDEEEKYLAQAQSFAPGHVAVLNARGMHALRLGDGLQARKLLQQAVAADSKAPMLWLNLALACRASKDVDAEAAALESALALDPYFFLALLQKARLLERQGKVRQAAGVYHAFLVCIGSQSLPSSMKPAVEHAQAAVQANRRALEDFLHQRTTALRAVHSADRLQRFDHCLDILVGKRRVYVQQPTFMNFPGLPAIQFYEREQFPWLPIIEAATDDVRSELTQLFAESSEGFVPYVANPAGTPLNQWKDLNHSLNWSAYYLWREGKPVEDHLARCPKTAAVLASIPRADVPNHAPTAFFSILKPRTRIPPHTGVTNTRLVAHLPLIVPAACGFRVGAEVREWVPGTAWVFDDTIEHEAWNDSDEPRAILIFDVWNPYLTEVERELVRETTAAVGDFYGGESPLSGGL